jgi:ABC-type branched-subunit amino acid transport system substrate-binding protein
MVPPRLVVLAMAFLLWGCTTGGMPSPGPSPSPAAGSLDPTARPSSPSPEPIALHVVMDLNSSARTSGLGYLEGMQLAVEEVNAAGGVGGRPVALELHDHAGVPARATERMEALLAANVTAILHVGAGSAISPLRQRFVESGTPVVLLEGDLYTSRGLFPQVFQTTIPWVWQANAIARYLVTDRSADDVVFVGVGPEAQAAADTLDRALQYWGGELDDAVTACPCVEGLERAAAADWVVLPGPPPVPLELANAIEEIAPLDGPGITGSAGLLVLDERLAHPEPGTSAAYPYTWAGWARPVPRVASFIERFDAMFGRPPAGLEQEGFDAIRVLAEGLRTTGGGGGPPLVHALEDLPERTFSGFPIDFGPDDHLFLPRAEVGLFAVPGPGESLDPWQSPGADGRLWRPIMRTFTYNGERTNVLERDRKLFFPFWDMSQPAPDYDRSRYGIVTGPNDPIH